jgi:hypothetical protein
MVKLLNSLPRPELLILLTVLTALGCTLSPISLRPTDVPEPSKLAELEYIQSPQGLYGEVAWLDDETLAVQYRTGLLGALSPRIWRLALDGQSFEMMDLPKHLSCGPDGENGFEAPERLLDGRMSYFVACRPAGDTFNIKYYLMALDNQTGQVTQLLDYPMPESIVGTGGFQWNPTMSIGLMGNANRFISEQMYRLSKEGWEELDVGLAQAYGPSWSPDGEQIAFIGAKEKGSPLTFSDLGLYLMSADAEDVHPVLEGFRVASGVAWAPQARWLAFPAAFGDGDTEKNSGLWLFDLEQDQVRQITEGEFGLPRWSPDGQRIAVVQFLGPVEDREHRVAIVDVGPLLGD